MDSQKTCGYQRRQVGGRNGLGIWDKNVKLVCDHGCTTINIIKLIELKKKGLHLLGPHLSELAFGGCLRKTES